MASGGIGVQSKGAEAHTAGRGAVVIEAAHQAAFIAGSALSIVQDVSLVALLLQALVL